MMNKNTQYLVNHFRVQLMYLTTFGQLERDQSPYNGL